MTWLQFVAAMTGSLAWPLTIVIVVLIFRRSLLALAPGLRALEYGSFKLTFAERLERAASTAAQLPPESSSPAPKALPPSTSVVVDNTPDIDIVDALTSPRGFVLQAWIKVEDAIRHALLDSGVRTRAGVTGMVHSLEQQGKINSDVVSIINDLRQLRNEAAHYPDFALEPQQAVEYGRLARRVVVALSNEAEPRP